MTASKNRKRARLSRKRKQNANFNFESEPPLPEILGVSFYLLFRPYIIDLRLETATTFHGVLRTSQGTFLPTKQKKANQFRLFRTKKNERLLRRQRQRPARFIMTNLVALNQWSLPSWHFNDIEEAW